MQLNVVNVVVGVGGTGGPGGEGGQGGLGGMYGQAAYPVTDIGCNYNDYCGDLGCGVCYGSFPWAWKAGMSEWGGVGGAGGGGGAGAGGNGGPAIGVAYSGSTVTTSALTIDTSGAAGGNPGAGGPVG